MNLVIHPDSDVVGIKNRFLEFKTPEIDYLLIPNRNILFRSKGVVTFRFLQNISLLYMHFKLILTFQAVLSAFTHKEKANYT